MGIFYTNYKIENSVERSKGITVMKLLVDTGSEYTWVSEKFWKNSVSIKRKKI